MRKWLHGPVYIITYIVLTHVIISLESQKSGYEVGFVVLTFYASAMMWYLVHQGLICDMNRRVIVNDTRHVQPFQCFVSGARLRLVFSTLGRNLSKNEPMWLIPP